MPQIAHHVFFTLTDQSESATQRLVDSCNQYLDGHPGVTYFAVGRRHPELVREVNDKEYDVSLHLVFEDRKAHDDYQVASRHKQFIEEQKSNWANVRIFDSNL